MEMGALKRLLKDVTGGNLRGGNCKLLDNKLDEQWEAKQTSKWNKN